MLIPQKPVVLSDKFVFRHISKMRQILGFIISLMILALFLPVVIQGAKDAVDYLKNYIKDVKDSISIL